MRRWVIAIATLVMLAVVNVGIWQHESLLRSGRVVLLELVPVDPRSLMQGDYMRLAYHVQQAAFPRLAVQRPRGDGRIIVTVDGRGVGRFVRLDDGTPLAPGEVALRYRVRAGEVKFASNAYFFGEGQGAEYAAARYGEFRVAADGEMMLSGLRDRNLQPLGRTSDR